MRNINSLTRNNINTVPSEPQIQATQSEAQAPTPVTNTGIAGFADGFETARHATNLFGNPDLKPATSSDSYQPMTPQDPTIDPSELFNYVASPQIEPAPPGPQEISGDQAANKGLEKTQSEGNGVDFVGSTDLSSILNDPNLPFEEKLALFLFDFLEKAEKDLTAGMENLDNSRKSQIAQTNSGGVNSNPGAEGQSGVNGQGKESEQIGLEKLKLAHEKMTKMFSLVDNMLTSIHRQIKDGPIAALRS